MKSRLLSQDREPRSLPKLFRLIKKVRTKKPKCKRSHALGDYPQVQPHVVLSSNERHTICEMFKNLKSMKTPAQLELMMQMIHDNNFNLLELQTVRQALEDRIKIDIISNVPYEIALYIMSLLSAEDLCRAAQTCRSWRTVCEDTRLWYEKIKEEGILDDEQARDLIFKKRITTRHSNQERLALDYYKDSPRWKSAYLKHLEILRNWRTRECKLKGTPAVEKRQTANPTVKPLLEIRCHEDFVITCLQFNPKTNTIVTGSDDHTLRVWSSETGKCISILKGHLGGVWSSELTPDGIVISGSTDRTVKVWNGKTGKLIHTLYGHSSTVRCLALNGTQVVSGSRDNTLRLWDINEGVCTNIFVGHENAVRCVEFKDDLVVSGAYDNVVKVWNALTGLCCFHLTGHQSRIYCLQFDGNTIVSGSLDTTICVWDVATGKLRHRLQGHTSLTSKMQLDGNILITANADSFCKIWNIDTGVCVSTLGGRNRHGGAITSLFCNKWHVVTSSDDGTIKLWDIKTGEFIRNILVLSTANQGGVVWRIRGSYTKLICAIGSRTQVESTHLVIVDFS